jgi:sulfatase maturation enzyme AslB (radical SAM superfamily)
MNSIQDLEVDFQKGLESLSANNFELANQLFKKILTHQASFNVLNAYSISCFKLQQFEEALKAINLAISIEPENVHGYNNKIEYLKALSRPEEAISCAHELELAHPELKELHLLKGDLYHSIGKVYPGDKEFKKYLHGIYPGKKEIDQLDARDTIYHIKHLQNKMSPYVQYPRHVAFETYAQCNAKCSFCVYPDMERIGTMMPMELIDKIINDLQEIPKHLPFQLSPFGVNEPFLDTRIYTILQKITDKLPNASITLTSNATPLNQINIDRLSEFTLEYLWLSIVDHRKDIYEEKMKLNYDLMLRNLELIHQAKANNKLKTRIVVSRLLDNTPYDQEFTNFIKERFHLFEVCLWPYGNWLQRTSNQVTENVANIPCEHWFEFRISSTGEVQHCCMDGHLDYPWGNVHTHSVLEIYNQDQYKQLRTNTFSRKQVSPCNTCSLR